MKAIYERELKSYFTGITGYLFIAFLLLFAGIYTMVINLKESYSNFEYVLSSLTFIFLIVVPVLTMRTIAEERRQKTDQLLYTLPVGMTKIVLAKYFSMVTILAIPVAILCFYPLILSLYGSIYLPTAYCALAGFFLLGSALIAVGMFVSSLTENQAVAAVLCFIVLLVNFFVSALSSYMSSTPRASFIAITIVIVVIGVIIWLMTKNGFFAVMLGLVLEIALAVLLIISSGTLGGLVPAVIGKLSLFSQFDNFTSGIFDLTGVTYFVMVSAALVFLTVQSLEKRRWN
ncbi:hypothetical protein SDC9_57855 [bioreactor metagenome]|uniref:ABC-2 type transporter domain-containing protein n=1 Tax=bioreactor metagenome TaxID=1076179 RepID=A0A644X604_9ZZZZ